LFDCCLFDLDDSLFEKLLDVIVSLEL
jgi:hypothetical protein